MVLSSLRNYPSKEYVKGEIVIPLTQKAPGRRL
jgi:hypothetical protein